MRTSALMVAGCGLTVAFLVGGTGLHAEEKKPDEVHVPKKVPPGELGEVIRLGKDLVENTATHPLSKPYVGNVLRCSSCHLNAGTDPKAATFVGVAAAYPAWSPREQRAITLEDRVLNCFMRSLNGVRPPNGSRLSVAITAYITWLSSGSPIKMNPEKPLGLHHVRPLHADVSQANSQLGKELYEDECAYCHGEEGKGADDGPPLWGPMSFNEGAGLSRTDKLAAWLKVAMPLGDPYLTEKQALDLAAYVTSQPRPSFDLKGHLPKPDRFGEYNGELSSEPTAR